MQNNVVHLVNSMESFLHANWGPCTVLWQKKIRMIMSARIFYFTSYLRHSANRYINDYVWQVGKVIQKHAFWPRVIIIMHIVFE